LGKQHEVVLAGVKKKSFGHHLLHKFAEALEELDGMVRAGERIGFLVWFRD